MKDRSMPLLLAFLALLAALPLTRNLSRPDRVPADQAEETPEPAQTSNAEPKDKEVEEDGPWPEPIRTYRSFFAVGEDRVAPDGEAAPDLPTLASNAQYTVDVLVALVPDPLDSHLGTNFDQSLDAIQRAYNKCGYLLDRVWLPWNRGAVKKRVYREVPGLLLFRKAKSRRLAVVLLVGETPKTGIHKKAFLEAVRLAGALRFPASKEPLPVLGPSFSGSALSLRLALLVVPDPNQDFKIVTGSATAPHLEETLAAGVPSRVDFCRMVVPDETLKKEAAAFLAEHLGWDFKKAAFFSETDTAYGQESAEDRFGHLVRIEFPNGLSDVRTALERDSGPRFTENIVIQVPGPLDLSLADRNQPVDRIGAFSPLSATAYDLALANLLTTLSRQGIRYIGILASDVRDRLFLARRIHELAPDVILFTFDNNLLYAHPEHSEEMDGMLVLSSFPLLTESDSWQELLGSSPGRRPFRRQFTTEFHQGVFWAALELIPDAHATRLPGTKAWIAVVGNGSLWPIAGLDLQEEDSRVLCQASRTIRRPGFAAAGASPEAEFESLAGRADLQLVILLGFLVLLARWLRKAPPPLVGKDARHGRRILLLGLGSLLLIGAILVIFGTLPLLVQVRRGEPVWDSLTRRRILFLAVLGATYVSLIWNVVRFSAVPGGRLSGASKKRRTWSELAGKLRRRHRHRGWILRAQAAATCSRLADKLHDEQRQRRWRRRALATLGVLLATAGLAWLLYLLWMPGGASLFHLRARKLTSGLSPLVSLGCLAAAVYAWCFAELRRLWLLKGQAIAWPVKKLCDPPLEGCAELAGEMERLLTGTLPWRRRGWMLLALALVAPTFLLLDVLQPIAETKAYGRVFLVLILSVFILGALSFCRFILLWSTLESLLNRLSFTPLAKAFGRISGQIAWNPMRSFGWHMPKFQMLVLAAEKFHPVGRLEDRTRLDDLLKKVFQAPPQSRKEIETRSELGAFLDGVSEQLAGGVAHPAVADFFAVRLVAYVRHIFAHLRDCLAAAMICGVLLLLAVRTYAFEPKQFVSVGVLGWLLVVVCITLWTFVQMDRNASLCAISGTPAGQVTFDRYFFFNILTYVAIPLLSVAVTQFPSVGKHVVGWLNPLLRIVGGG